MDRYATNYHPFMPVVPDFALAPQNIDRVAREEAFLLTIILTIASKDDFELSAVHHHCCQHTKRLLLDVLLALPPTFGVGTVEGLLVLSEWLPYISFTSSPSMESARGSFPEDSTAWSLIGQAIRHAYMLRLDRMSFYDGLSEEEKKHALRERLAWTCMYCQDNQTRMLAHYLDSCVLGRQTDFGTHGPVFLVSRIITLDQIHYQRLLPPTTSGRR